MHEPAPGAAEPRVTVIEPPRGLGAPDWREVWRLRGLLSMFLWRDMVVRYKQTMLGVFWIVLQPLMVTAIYSVFFGYIARIPTEGKPYPVYVLATIVLWQFFARTVSEAGTSVHAQQALIGKVYFPRVVLPISAALSSGVDFLINFAVGLLVISAMGYPPSPRVAAAPLFFLATAAFAVGLGFWLSALDALYRDVRYLLSSVLQVWYFATPILYPITAIPESWRWVFWLNPMVPLVQGFRWCVLDGVAPPDTLHLGLSVALIVAVFYSGAAFFHRVEHTIVDRV
jgi:lipopolysaccharide transport system permease protein